MRTLRSAALLALAATLSASSVPALAQTPAAMDMNKARYSTAGVYTGDRNQMQGPAQSIAQALGSADSLFLADDGDSLSVAVEALTAAGANLRRVQLLGTANQRF